MRVKAVLFDLVETLVKLVEGPKTYNRILEDYGVEVSAWEFLEA